MKPLTLQEAFDKALFGIRAQNYVRSQKPDSENCMYRGDNGTKCAVGHCIPDDVMDELLERRPGVNSGTISSLTAHSAEARHLLSGLDSDDLRDLQEIHDSMYSGDEFEYQMEGFARAHNLHFTEIAK